MFAVKSDIQQKFSLYREISLTLSLSKNGILLNEIIPLSRSFKT